eukprot:COSAG05_NODE_5164_length_1248_cov_0.970409_1_plen_92_part_00
MYERLAFHLDSPCKRQGVQNRYEKEGGEVSQDGKRYRPWLVEGLPPPCDFWLTEAENSSPPGVLGSCTRSAQTPATNKPDTHVRYIYVMEH